jgi:Flp pilus assembly protein CpaB
MKPVTPRRRGGVNPYIAGALVIVTTLVVVGIANFSGLRLSLFGPEPPSTAGLIAVPTPSRPIPAYTRITRDHLWDPVNNRLSVVYLPPSAVTPEMLRKLPQVIGRVLNHDKAAGYVFTDADFMPNGTREGLVAGIPAGKRAIRIPADRVDGLYGLHGGDRFDLVATMPIDAGRGAAQNFGFGGVYGQQLALEARLSNWQRQATVHVIVQNGVIVQPMATREVPVAQASLAEGTRSRTRPVQEVVIAVDPEEVARLTEAIAVDATVWMVPRSGRPDDPVDSRTPDLRPVSPFAGTGLGDDERSAFDENTSSYRVVETITGQKRELLAVPRP